MESTRSRVSRMAQRKQIPHMSEQAASSEQGVLQELRDALRRFAADRDWDQFHTPKNLAMALSVEAGELLEHFQWVKDSESEELSVEKIGRVAEELADVF